MLSIIICSRARTLKNELIININNTVGFSHELIVIDNSENNYSIFEAYNKGIKESKGEYLCFLHDDILIHTEGWGKVINRIFQEDKKIGLVGIAGSKIKTKMPSSWSDCDEKHKVINVIQHFNDANPQKMECGFKDNNTVEEVVVVDGVFMAVRKIDELYFNTNLKGYHNYDLSLSLDIRIKGLKNVVTKLILIEHFSIGTINKAWYTSAFLLFKMYGAHLPKTTRDSLINKNELKLRELINGAAFVSQLLKHKLYAKAFKFWFKIFLIKPTSLYHLILIKQLLKF